MQAHFRGAGVGSEAAPGVDPRGAEGGLMVAHVHHRIPRCLLKVHDRGHGPGLEPEDLQAWFEWEEEAFRHEVDPDISRGDLASLIESSTVELEGREHRASHSAAGDFVRWGRLGGLKTSALYGPGWFALLARRRWKKITTAQLEEAFAAVSAGRS